MDRCSELASPTAPAHHGTFIGSRLQDRTEPARRMAASTSELSSWVFTKRLGFGRVAQPNESRLSCGAELECSQTEFYHTACKTFAEFIGDGRRQLQALVRLRTTSHSLGPSFHRAPRSTRRNRPLTSIVMPNGPLLGIRQPHRSPHTTGLTLGRAFRIEPNRPDGCRLRLGAVQLGVHKKTWF